jgi:hypothetical protein
MKSRRFRPWIARRRCCPCDRVRRNGAPTTTVAMAPPRCLPRSMPKSGNVIGQTHRRHRSLEFRKFLDRIDDSLPPEGGGAHRHGQLRNPQNAAHPRLVRQASALSRAFHSHLRLLAELVERWFAELTTKQSRRGAHRSVSDLERAIGEFLDAHNTHPKPFTWTKSADQILASIARFAHCGYPSRTTYVMNHCYRTLADLVGFTPSRAGGLIRSPKNSGTCPRMLLSISICLHKFMRVSARKTRPSDCWKKVTSSVQQACPISR